MIENHGTKQIEQMLSYLFENFDTISTLIEREKNKPKAVFGFKAGGVFNPTKEDLLWGSGLGLDNKEEPLGEAPTVPKVDSTNHRESKEATLSTKEKPVVDLYSTTDIIIEEPTKKETNNDALTNDTTDSSAPDLLLRDEDEATEPGDNSITSEPRGDEDPSNTTEAQIDEGSRDRIERGLDGEGGNINHQTNNPWHRPKPKKADNLFNSSITHTQPVIKRNINHDSFYEQEYKDRCEKKGWKYKTKEQRYEEAKTGAENIRDNRERPFNDFRKLW